MQEHGFILTRPLIKRKQFIGTVVESSVTDGIRLIFVAVLGFFLFLLFKKKGEGRFTVCQIVSLLAVWVVECAQEFCENNSVERRT